MAQLPQNYVPENTESSSGYEPLPEGEYQAIVKDSQVKPTKAGTGTILVATMEVIDGPKQGKVEFSNFNLENPNPTAVEIGHSQLKKLSESCGKPNARDSSEFHNIPFILRVYKNKKGDLNHDFKPYGANVTADSSESSSESGDKPSWAGAN